MEVLLEIGSSRKPLNDVTEQSLVNLVEAELKVMGEVALLTFGKSPSDFPSGYKEFYTLQRWSDKWASFVDVKEAKEVTSGDRLTVVPFPKSSTSVSPLLDLKDIAR